MSAKLSFAAQNFLSPVCVVSFFFFFLPPHTHTEKERQSEI